MRNHHISLFPPLQTIGGRFPALAARVFVVDLQLHAGVGGGGSAAGAAGLWNLICLSPNAVGGNLWRMTAAAAKVLEEFEALDPQDQMVVRDQVLSVTQQRQREALDRLRGSGKGTGLVGKLLEERRRDLDRE